jgi:Domain of unknown function (DUF4918)
MELVSRFFHTYYEDNDPRTLLLGINPGRFGAGVTGVNFTAPKQLTENLGIDHSLKMQSELSAEFIYKVVEAYGGAVAFYKDLFIGSVCPLGFVRHGININYYDDKELLRTVEPFIIQSIDALARMPFRKEVCHCIGGEKNFKYLTKLNEQHRWFKNIVPLPHPRFIMQYRRKRVEEYVELYVRQLRPGL